MVRNKVKRRRIRRRVIWKVRKRRLKIEEVINNFRFWEVKIWFIFFLFYLLKEVGGNSKR